jgi:hypothetical protein
MNTPSNHLCHGLDDFVDGAMSPPEDAAFRTHMESCAACREAVDQQRWIDGLLASDEAAAMETSPAPWMIPRRRVGRRRVVVAAVAAAFVVGATAALFLPLPRQEGLGEGRPTVAHAPTAEPSRTLNSVGPIEGSNSNALATDGNPSQDEDPTTALRSVATGDRARLLPSLPERGESAASFASAGSAIAVPLASGDPQVTIVQLFPTVTAQRRWAREAAMRSTAISPTGG